MHYFRSKNPRLLAVSAVLEHGTESLEQCTKERKREKACKVGREFMIMHTEKLKE